jgi:hypothetical protein
MLAAAGFVPKKADNPQRMATLGALPPHQFVTRQVNGEVTYLYGDPTLCGCVYVGDQDADDHYRQRMATVQTATDAQIRSVLSSSPLPREAASGLRRNAASRRCPGQHPRPVSSAHRRLAFMLSPTAEETSQSALLAELLQSIGNFLSDGRERILVQHARDSLSISRTEKKCGSRQVRVATRSITDVDQQRHFFLRYPSRELLQVRGRDRQIARGRGFVPFRQTDCVTGYRLRLH